MKLLDVHEVSDKTKNSVSGCWKKASDEDSGFPQPIKIGGKTLWIEEEVDEYLKLQVEKFRDQARVAKRPSVFKAAKASVVRRLGKT